MLHYEGTVGLGCDAFDSLGLDSVGLILLGSDSVGSA